MKKGILVLLIVIMVLSLSGCTIIHNNNAKAKLQVIEYDNATNETRIYREYVIHDGDEIFLRDEPFYECKREPNDIKIVHIKKNYVMISRDVLRYDKNNYEKTYTQKFKEKIKYNLQFATSIDETRPDGPECGQARYHYLLMFVKD